MDNLAGLVSALKEFGITPLERALYGTAMTHSSYVNEHPDCAGDNERLEFLGDAVLSLIISEHLYRAGGDMPEGFLTRTRARAVCEPSLAAAASEMDLGRYLRLGRGEDATGGRLKPSVLADAFEALVAAVYLDSGLEAARQFVAGTLIKDLARGPWTTIDHKTALQEMVQAGGAGRRVTYETVSEDGPDHDRRFTVIAIIDGLAVGTGTGKSKRLAEQDAARDAISRMGPGSV
ncbi:MAG: ribonuclease III [Ignavibacteriales bacterium]